MDSAAHETPTSSTGSGRFERTLWSDVFAAGQPDRPGSALALERLCRIYWHPIYGFLRRRGFERQAALDLTQGFFQYLLKKNIVQAASPEKGRFRSFLLGSVKNFISNEADRQSAMKRGGGTPLLSLDEETAEGQDAHEPADNRSPEKLFDRRWALSVIEETVRRLEIEFKQAGSEQEFSHLKAFLNDDRALPYAELSLRLNRSETALRSAVSRMRKRFRELISEVVSETVSSPQQVEAELQHLKASLREQE